MVNNVRVSAVVLAGGISKRMGKENKLLIKLNKSTLVNITVDTAVRSNVAETIVVTGHETNLVQKSLSNYPVRFVHNPYYQNGLSTSLSCGIKAVSKNIDGALVVLSDMPWVRIETINALIDRFNTEKSRVICRPTFNDKVGNPVLWPRIFFPELIKIKGDKGARNLIKKYSQRVFLVKVNDTGIHKDINEPNDLKII